MTVFYKDQCRDLEPTFEGYLAALCPGFAPVRELFPIIFCLGSMAPCNDATFKLPQVTLGSIPKLAEIKDFYSEAMFAQVVPGMIKSGALPPCYESCRATMKEISECTALASISSGKDNCIGLPLQADGKCVVKPGSKVAPKPAKPEEIKPVADAKTPNGANGLVVGGLFLASLVLLLI